MRGVPSWSQVSVSPVRVKFVSVDWLGAVKGSVTLSSACTPALSLATICSIIERLYVSTTVVCAALTASLPKTNWSMELSQREASLQRADSPPPTRHCHPSPDIEYVDRVAVATIVEIEPADVQRGVGARQDRIAHDGAAVL